MGDDRKAEYEMAPTSDPENPEPPAEKTELQTQETEDQQWSGLGKEELLRVADTPAWNWTRNILLILFWIAWILMLMIAIILVVKAPSCPDVEWYEKSPIYQVNVRSFQDSDGDGFGDIKGLKTRVQKIKEEFGAETIVLSPIFEQAPGTQTLKSYGYNVVDFMEIDPILGELADFRALVNSLQENGMHVILEFVPNHTSDKHKWFTESSKSKDSEFRNYYIWAPGTDGGPPNDWKNFYGESAWTLGDDDEYYYHYYNSSQPDLNYGNSNVTAAIQRAMDFWLDSYNVDGFVIADADHLVEGPITTSSRKRRQAEGDMVTEAMATTPTMMTDGTTLGANPDLPVTGEMDGGDMEGGDTDGGDTDGGDTDSGSPQYTVSGDALSPEAKKVLNDMYEVLDQNNQLGKIRVFIPQHSGELKDNVLYQDNEWNGFPVSLSFASKLGDSTNSYMIKDQLNDLFNAPDSAEKEGLWNGWMIGRAGIDRVANRAGVKTRALTMLQYTLPGTPLPFYGDELELTNLPSGVSPELPPYPWDNSEYGGFMSGNKTAPWQSVVDDIENKNAETQGKTDGSFLNYVQNLTEFHSKPSILAGSFNLTAMTGEFIAYRRSFPEWPEFVVAINLGDSTKESASVLESDLKGQVVLSSSGDGIGDVVDLSSLTVAANEALLIELARCETCLF